MDAPRSTRARARAAQTEAIKATARRQLAEAGSAGLSLRAVARELGVASSALYRYFSSRDELLTALIIDAYDASGAAAEAAAAAAGDDPGRRWLAACRAVRRWALAHRAEFALVYGSPVPGYAAPADTIGPATRITTVLVTAVVDAAAAGHLHPPPPQWTGPSLVTDAARSAAADAAAVAPDLAERVLTLWVALVGTISFELFGHFHQVVADPDTYFDVAMAIAAESVGLPLTVPAR